MHNILPSCEDYRHVPALQQPERSLQPRRGYASPFAVPAAFPLHPRKPAVPQTATSGRSSTGAWAFLHECVSVMFRLMMSADRADSFASGAGSRARAGPPKVQEFFALGDLKLPKLPSPTARNPGQRLPWTPIQGSGVQSFFPAPTGRNPGLRLPWTTIQGPGVQSCPSPTAEADWGQLLVTVPVSLPLGPGWRKSHGDSELRELHRQSERSIRRQSRPGASRPESNGMCKLCELRRRLVGRAALDGECECANFAPPPARSRGLLWRVSICQLHRRAPALRRRCRRSGSRPKGRGCGPWRGSICPSWCAAASGAGRARRRS